MRRSLFVAAVAALLTTQLNAQCINAFNEGFESGSYTPTWTMGTAPTVFSVVTASPTPAVGTYCLTGNNGNSTHLTGLNATIPASTPTTASWYMYPSGTAAGNYVLLGDNTISATNCLVFCYYNGSQVRFVSGTTYNYTPTLNQWLFVELRNINYVSRTFDIYLNGILQQTGFPFRSTTCSNITKVHLYNFTPGSTAAWDEIILGSVPVTSFTSVTAVSCNGGANGSSNLTVSSGTSPYTFLWSNSATTEDISGVAAGTYSVVITDANGCMDTALATITEPTAITVGTMQTNILCSGGNNGDAMVMPSGGTPGYTYAWSSGGTGATESGLIAGTYTCTVTDANGCTNVQTVTITEPALLSGVATSSGSICIGDSAMLNVVAMGGTPNHTFNWLPGNLPGAMQTVMPSVTETYTVEITDANGCTVTATTTVNVNPLPVVNLGTDTTVCGSIVLDAGNAGSTYIWSNGDSVQLATVATGGIYNVTVTDVNGCLGSDTVVVAVDAISDAGSIYHTGGADLCVGDTSSLITLGANANVDWWVLPGAGPFWQYVGSGNPFTQQIASPNDVGLYYFYAIAVNGVCPADTSNTISIEIHALPSVQLGADTATCSGGVTLDAQNSGASYLWSTGDTTQTTIVNTSGQYMVSIVDINGCAGSDSINVTINQPPVVTGTASSLTPCLDDANVTLTGMPSPGTWSGPGVTGNTFDPSVGAGAQILTYAHTDTNGCSGSFLLTINVNACVGISENATFEYSVFPNPNNGAFTIAFSNTMENVIVEMVDINGRTVFAQQFDVNAGDQKQLDFSGEANGMYLMRVTTAQGTSMQRILIED